MIDISLLGFIIYSLYFYDKQIVIQLQLSFSTILNKPNIMKTAQFILGILFISTFLAFTSFKDNHDKFIGVYGSKGSYAIIINPDKTFTYIDNTQIKNINVSGKWEVKGKELILNSDTKSKMISKWTLTNKDSCLKSKKGFTIYTLCRKCD